MSYMIEGGSSKTMSKSKAWLYRHREASHKLLGNLTEIIVEYLSQQVVAGAQASLSTYVSADTVELIDLFISCFKCLNLTPDFLVERCSTSSVCLISYGYATACERD